jgi:hypothetical protein
MKHIKKINELKISSIITHYPVVEKARINDPIDFTYDVFVYGGDSYGSGRKEHGDPHFHFADKIKGGNWQFSILIPTVEEWNQNKELYIYEISNGEFNWRGFKKEKKELIDWLDIQNNDLTFYTNLEVIRYNWNTLNKTNKNVKQIKKIK